MYKVTIDLPNLAEGGELLIDGLGVLHVGDNEVSDEDANVYVQRNVRMEPAYVEEGDKQVFVGMTQVVPDFKELVERVDGVTVEKVEGSNATPVAEESVSEDNSSPPALPSLPTPGGNE